MATLFPNYSPKDLKVSWAGYNIIGMTNISFEYNSDIISASTSLDGYRSRSISPDKSGTCTITLAQGSPSNVPLSVAMAGAKNGYLISLPMAITDPSGSVLALLKDACLMKGPSVELAEEAGEREYVFDVAELDFASAGEKVAKTLGGGDKTQVLAGVSAVAENMSKFV